MRQINFYLATIILSLTFAFVAALIPEATSIAHESENQTFAAGHWR